MSRTHFRVYPGLSGAETIAAGDAATCAQVLLDQCDRHQLATLALHIQTLQARRETPVPIPAAAVPPGVEPEFVYQVGRASWDEDFGQGVGVTDRAG
jgi:hypothetical protein